jgi:hypothetical protein
MRWPGQHKGGGNEPALNPPGPSPPVPRGLSPVIMAAALVVSVDLVAQQTDGTVKTYQGSYTVDAGVIVRSHIEQVS